MQAQNLTISIPADKCDKDCPYCISKITWKTKPNIPLMNRNIQKVKRLATIAGVTSVLITSKKEPFQNYEEMIRIANLFSRDNWLEIQTNGVYFSKNPYKLTLELYQAGVNVLAISVDRMKSINRLSESLKILSDFGIVTRLCLNITGFITDIFTFDEIMTNIISVGNVRQVLLRNINYPKNANINHPVVIWIDKNVNMIEGYQNLYNQMMKMKLDKIRTIPQTGLTTYDYNDISVCFSDYCIQESNEYENIRSLIIQDDGHVYTSWDKKASILF
jgi:molybdenum cofactor biosynthesis enzyme MoaA